MILCLKNRQQYGLIQQYTLQNKMLKKAKFVATSEHRTKGLSFHPTLPWLLASMHSGTVYLYDYFAGSLIATFIGHEGPVRSVSFHETQPLFVSGGDDFKVKLWHHFERRCLYTFSHHSDYVRSVEFHKALPWILTASDDQTICILNWQNRACLYTITGHSHYVMCAAFHPEDDLILSASLDNTVRVWDYSELKKKYSTSTGADDVSEVVLKIQIEGHDKFVDWAAFHPKKKLIVSSADDQLVKIWRYQDNQAWEIQTLRGHSHNVTGCFFISKRDLLLTCSEDRTIIVWDYNNARMLHKHYGIGRMWKMALHPKENYIAAGYDQGLMVFKIAHERPPFERIAPNVLCRVFNQELQLHDLPTKKTTTIKKLAEAEPLSQYWLYVNLFDTSAKVFLILRKIFSWPYEWKHEVYVFPNSMIGKGDELKSQGEGLATFIGRDNICVLSKGELIIINYNGTVKKRLEWNEDSSPAEIAQGPLGKFLVRYGDSFIGLYDIASRKVVSKIRSAFRQFKRVLWNKSLTLAAFIFKTGIIITDKTLSIKHQISLKETVLSVHFDDKDVLIYSTHQHIKYMLPSDGSIGIITSTEKPIYAICIANSVLYYMDRSGAIGTLRINMGEYLFRLSISKGDITNTQRILKEGQLWGSSAIRYLDKKGYPELALEYEKNSKERFALAISSGNLEIALYAAMEMKEKDCFMALGNEALRLGNVQVAEVCFQKTLAFEKLAFLYLVTGNISKLRKLMVLAKTKLKDPMLTYQIALSVGDVPEMVKVLAEAGQIALAKAAAQTHGLRDMAEKLGEIHLKEKTKLVFPMKSLVGVQNWPIEKVARKKQEVEETTKAEEEKGINILVEKDAGLDDIINGIFLYIIMQQKGQMWKSMRSKRQEEEENYKLQRKVVGLKNLIWLLWNLLLLQNKLYLQFLLQGSPLHRHMEQNLLQFNAKIPWFLDILRLQTHLKPHSDFCKSKSHQLTQLPLKTPLQNLQFARKQNFHSFLVWEDSAFNLLEKTGSPQAFLHISTLFTMQFVTTVYLLQKGLKCTTNGEFTEALKNFRKCLHTLPLLTPSTEQEEKAARKLIDTSAEYVTALRCQLEKAKVQDKVRALELSCYMCICKMEDTHQVLALKNAVGACYKANNFITASHLCKRILDFKALIPEDTATQYEKYYSKMNAKGTNELKLQFDSAKIGQIEEGKGYLCAITLKPLQNARNYIKCPYDMSTFEKGFEGKLCPTCEMCKIGTETIGLKLYNSVS
eukprot:TRINITY_DN2102_c3_g2_i2.p1 TRINITY_DN2102_c3_g2~~TRINITY_DN2102_c3_g2_i2.p1  ORF type:complete len:1245 (-),score=113.50 TRINITY_DN2102_c3_g2_i2:5218-8952(-)